ncbi:MAG TPA: hypothetical protein DEG70_04645 [Chloroflexi bacterium]|nr:hypothetical protein [Chloroflexota bacterium]
MRLNHGRLLIGIVLVLLGVLLILERAGMVGSFNVWSLWPLFVVAVGLSILSSGGRANLGGWIVTGVGVVLLVQSLDLFSFNLWSIFGALVLVGIGVSFILRRDMPLPDGSSHSSPTAGTTGNSSIDDVVNLTTIFNDNDVVSAATAFRGGSATLIFGDVDLDLSRAQLSPNGAVLNVTMIFGDLDVTVPAGWTVRVDGTSILGDIKNHAASITDPTQPGLVIRATTIFGDIDVNQRG